MNPSETFINRLISNHVGYEPIGMCVNKYRFAEHLPVYEQPKSGFRGLLNSAFFHLNLSLPFYREVIQTELPDIIHAHFGFDGYRMYGVARQTNTPLIVSFYGSDVSRLPTEFDWNRRYKNLAANAQGFIAASQLMKSQLIKLGFPEEKISVINFGVDVEKFTFQKNVSSDNRLIMVGRMVEKKGFRYAIKALQILKNRGRKLHLDLYGDGPLKGELEKLTKKMEVENQVSFHGYVTNGEVQKELQNHITLLVPSVTASDDDKEGLPNTILEGMASGLPVIASDHAAIPETIIHNQTGLLVPERDPEAIADTLEQLLNKEFDLENVRRKARDLIEERYSLNRFVQDVEALYTRVIEDYEKK